MLWISERARWLVNTSAQPLLLCCWVYSDVLWFCQSNARFQTNTNTHWFNCPQTHWEVKGCIPEHFRLTLKHHSLHSFHHACVSLTPHRVICGICVCRGNLEFTLLSSRSVFRWSGSEFWHVWNSDPGSYLLVISCLNCNGVCVYECVFTYGRAFEWILPICFRLSSCLYGRVVWILHERQSHFCLRGSEDTQRQKHSQTQHRTLPVPCLPSSMGMGDMYSNYIVFH